MHPAGSRLFRVFLLVAAVAALSPSADAQNPPPDLRGIYIYTNDVSSITTATANQITASLSIPGVDGVAIVIGWNSIEPALGQYQFALLDQWVAQAISLGKKIDLVVPAGASTPAWLFQPAPTGAGATQLNFTISPHGGQTGVCDTVNIAAPWDPAFLVQWDAMLAALSAHLKSTGTYNAITLVRLTGINRTTEEMRLPAETAASTGLACVSNALTTWQAAGYRPSLVLQAWNSVLGSFTKSFPDKSFAVSIIPNDAFPGIAQDGSLITGAVGDQNEPLLMSAAQKLPGRFVVQFDFLMPGEIPSVVVTGAAQNYGTLAAFQTNEYLGGSGAACSEPVTNPTPCTAATFLQLLETGIFPLGRSSPLRSQYIEVFHDNAASFPASILQGHLELTCSYALSYGGQSFAATGGTGTIAITTGAGCPWSVGAPPVGVTFTSATNGTGNGTVTFNVAANSGGDLSGSFNIADQVFTVDQQASRVAGLNFIGSMPHLAAEGGWNTTFTFVNKGSTRATARTSFFAPDGSALPLPTYSPQPPLLPGLLLAASLDQSIVPNASLTTIAAGPAPSYLEGSAQLAATGALDGFAIFHYVPTNQEAVVPMETRNAASYILPFDNTNGVLTGVALENVSAIGATISIVIRDDKGNTLLNSSVTLNGSGHTSFVLSDSKTGFPVTANIRGTIEFDTPTSGQISVLGIRYTGGTLTTIPVLANVGTSGGLMAHLASGAGWQTTFVFVNTGTSLVSSTLNFFSDNGSAMALPVTFPQGGAAQTAASLMVPTFAGASYWIQTAAPITSALLSGSAVLTTTGNVSGYAIFRYNPNGQEAVVPLESRNAGTYLIAFDNTNNTTTGVAINSMATQNVSVPVTLRDDQGNILATSTIALNANGHTSFLLATQYPRTAGLRGTAEFDVPGFGTPNAAKISVLGIRSPPALTFTTLPALAK